jgi:bifunctional N-acetylglucosamine-1-phosphate-uridyltransferase/glucosamine-1-phosphate-acetyltransferase GlmU-like protein
MNVMVIPAAGRGTRLNTDQPKILYPVGGHPMLNYLVRRYRDFVERFIIVVNPKDKHLLKHHLDGLNIDYQLRYQSQATGMLDAILMALPDVQQPNVKFVWISWCDQIAISYATAEKLRRCLSTLGPNGGLVVPTVVKAEPYIHLEKDQQQKFISVLQRREGDVMPDYGLNDSGLFAMSANVFCDELQKFARSVQLGDATAERNFLPFIPWFNEFGDVISFAIDREIESIGVNTKQDATQIQSYLEPL